MTMHAERPVTPVWQYHFSSSVSLWILRGQQRDGSTTLALGLTPVSHWVCLAVGAEEWNRGPEWSTGHKRRWVVPVATDIGPNA